MRKRRRCRRVRRQVPTEPKYKDGHRVCENCGKALEIGEWTWIAINKVKRWLLVCKDARLCYGKRK